MGWMDGRTDRGKEGWMDLIDKEEEEEEHR